MSSLLKTLRPLTLALLLISAALGVLTVWRAWRGTEAQVLLATPARQYAPGAVNLALPAQQAQVAIRDHALLHASREFFTPPTPVAVPATPPRPEYRLAGTFIIPRKPTVALLVNTSGASRKVRTGDELDGWIVQSVERGRVVLQFDSESMEITGSARAAAGGLTVAPLSRGAPAAQASPSPLPSLIGKSASADAQAFADTSPEATEQTAAPALSSVKVLGAASASDGASRGGVREASAAGRPSSSEARLYRPPPQ